MQLSDPAARARLADTVGEVDRLVLLGDVVELRQSRALDALAAASRILPDVVAGLPDGAEIVVVPGNHDHALSAGWALRRSTAPEAPLELEQPIAAVPGEPLDVLLGMLAAPRRHVRAAYPGVWLRDDVYAHHGHYLDRHTTVPLFERLGAAAMTRLTRTSPAVAAPPFPPATVAEYERVLAPLYAWMYPIAQARVADASAGDSPSLRAWKLLQHGRGPRRWLLSAGAHALVAGINRTSLGPLSASALRGNIDGAELPAFAAVLDALGVRARYAIFGHTHRAGPLAGDSDSSWTTPSGIRMINCGSWVWDGPFDDAQGRVASPYRPGFAVLIDGDAAPQIVDVIGGVAARPAALRAIGE